MAFVYPPLEQQQVIFDYIRSDIDQGLREVEVDKLLEDHGYTIPEIGNDLTSEQFSKIVVARHYGYSTQLADVDHDLDPLAEVWTSEYEVGIRHEVRKGHRLLRQSYEGLLVSRSIFEDQREPTALGLEMDERQLNAVHTAIGRLITAKSRIFIPALTKSLLQVNPAGD